MGMFCGHGCTWAEGYDERLVIPEEARCVSHVICVVLGPWVLGHDTEEKLCQLYRRVPSVLSPTGSKYPLFEASGSNNHTLNGVWSRTSSTRYLDPLGQESESCATGRPEDQAIVSQASRWGSELGELPKIVPKLKIEATNP